MQPPYQATSKENRTNTGEKRNVSKQADIEMQKVLMAHMETNMMNLSYNGTINNQWETLCEKVYKHLLTLWGTQPGNTRIGLVKMMLRFYHCLRKGVGHMMHFCPNSQETENCATRKQNLNCTKTTSNSKCLVGQES